MSSVNKVILLGRVGKDAETKQAGSTTLAKFSVATSEKYKDKSGEPVERTEWHNIVAWGKLADICGQYVVKGMQVYVEGSLETKEWEKDGEKRRTTQVRADKVVFLGSKNGSSAPRANQTAADDWDS